MFYQIGDYLGVDTAGDSGPTIMVPQGGFNLVVHDSGRDAFLQADPGIVVLDLTGDLRASIGKAAHSLLVRGISSSAEGATGRLIGASTMVPELLGTNRGAKKRLLAITSKMPKDYSLKVDGKALTIQVRRKRMFNLTFCYFVYTGKLPYNTATPDVGEASANVKDLNGYFTVQANIEFALQNVRKFSSADWYDARNNPDSPSYLPTFGEKAAGYIEANIKMDDGAPAIDGTADTFTVFMVPSIVAQGGDGMAFHIVGSKAVWVPWTRPSEIPGTYLPGVDWFINCLGHELCHQLPIGHPDDEKWHSARDGVLVNRLFDSVFKKGMLIDSKVLSRINPI